MGSWCRAICPCIGGARVEDAVSGSAEDSLLEGGVTVPVGSARSTSSIASRVSHQDALRQGHSCGLFTNRRGLAMWEQRFEPPVRVKPKAAMLFLHGIHEHCARYDHVLAKLAKDLGAIVYSFDQQSHGRSEDVRGLRGACNSFQEFVDDAEDYVKRIKSEHPELDVFLFGQSFGGLVCAHLVLKNPGLVKGLILSSPAINIEWNLLLKVQGRAAGLASTYFPDVAMIPAVRPEDMSKDENAVNEYANDPLNTIGPLRNRIGHETLLAFKSLAKQRKQLTIDNLLIVFGDTDRCCSLPEAKTFFEHVQSPNKEFKVFEGLYHTLFHEPEKDDVIEHVLDWLRPITGTVTTSSSAQLSSI